MLRLRIVIRNYCEIATKAGEQLIKSEKRKIINFKELRHTSKIPPQPIEQKFPDTKSSDIVIDAKTIQLLERLSLVDLDSKEALATLRSSIQFADKIAHIDTSGVEPLYTVLEEQNLELREDRVTEGNCREELLRNAKTTDEDYYVAPPGNIPLEQEAKDFKTDA